MGMNISPLLGETRQTLLCHMREIAEVPFGVALDQLQMDLHWVFSDGLQINQSNGI